MLHRDVYSFDDVQYWSSTASNNVAFISAMLKEGEKKGYSVGKLTALVSFLELMVK